MGFMDHRMRTSIVGVPQDVFSNHLLISVNWPVFSKAKNDMLGIICSGCLQLQGTELMSQEVPSRPKYYVPKKCVLQNT